MQRASLIRKEPSRSKEEATKQQKIRGPFVHLTISTEPARLRYVRLLFRKRIF